MSDLLIRDVPEGVLRALDLRATALGLSRAEYLRRLLAQEVAKRGVIVDVDSLRHFSAVFDGLRDSELMSKAWE